MIIKNRNSWIAVIFLLFIFVIPVTTLITGGSASGMEMSEADSVLAGNGTTANKEVVDETGSEANGITADDTTDGKQDFVWVQDVLTGFTEKLFLRSAFISVNSDLTHALTGGTYMESTQVLLGKDDWLFYKTQNDGYPIYDYMGINHFTEAELAAMADNLIMARDYFEKERGVSFVAVTIPNKEIVYEEYMPDTIARVNSVSRGGQFAQYMWENTDVRYVYPMEAFLRYKEKYPLFYKTDTHWNHIGAFVGVQDIFGALYGTAVTPDVAEFREVQTDFAGDLAVIAGVSDKYAVDKVYEFVSESVDATQKREETAVVVGDSFGGFLSVIAGGYYEEVYWIDTDDFNVGMLEEYAPDVLIWESVERLQEVFMQESLLD